MFDGGIVISGNLEQISIAKSPTVFESFGISRLNSEIPALSRYAANNFTNIFNISDLLDLDYTNLISKTFLL